MPVFKGMDLVSSSPLVPARVVQSFKAGVQDAGGVANYFKKQAVGDGNVIQNVADGAAFISEVSQSGFSLDMALDAVGGVGGRNKSRGKHHDESSDRPAGSCETGNSFDPNTLVLMADGSRKPIKDVKLGDKVLATDPTTGKSAAREVTDVRSHASQRTLVELTIGTGSVVATDEHPFWVASDKRWSHAIDLKPGHKLATPDNRDATITGTRSWSESRRVYNLTVDTDHTYSVAVANGSEAVAVVVHNSDPCTEDDDEEYVDFAHGTTLESAMRIKNGGGLSFESARERTRGAKAPGSFFAIRVDFEDPSRAVTAAYHWGASRHAAAEHCVLICSLPVSTVRELEQKTLLSHTDTPVQSAFAPGSFGTVNERAKWRIIRLGN
jgi:hypothetical protein